MLLGWRSVIRRPGRLFTTALAFALAVLVIVLIQGFSDGLHDTYTGLVRQTPVDLWIGERGVQGVANTASSVPATLAAEITDLPGIRSVIPLYAVPTIGEAGGRKVPLMLYGYDLSSGLGGPWSLAAGRPPAAEGELVLDRAFAKHNDLAVGDSFTLQGRDFRVTGLSAGTNSFMFFAVFAERAEVGRLLQAPDRTSFLMVQLDPGASREQVRRLIPPGYAVYTPEDLIDSSVSTLNRVLGGPLYLLLGVAFLVGLAVVSLTTYAGVLERREEYGLLRAMGMTDAGLIWLVMTEVFVSALVGILAGVGLASVLAVTLSATFLAAYPILVTPESLGATVLMGLLMGLAGALLPLRRILRLDPASVFRV